jgi:hypothetical protein
MQQQSILKFLLLTWLSWEKELIKIGKHHDTAVLLPSLERISTPNVFLSMPDMLSWNPVRSKKIFPEQRNGKEGKRYKIVA